MSPAISLNFSQGKHQEVRPLKKKINQEVSMFMVPSGFAIIPVPTILSVLKMGCADNAPILRIG